MLKDPVMLGPNIIGSFNSCFSGDGGATGCFTGQGRTGEGLAPSSTGDVKYNVPINFNASLSSSIYSNNETVQPPSNQVLIIIKT